MLRNLLLLLGGLIFLVILAGALMAVPRYLREIIAARAALQGFGSQIAVTPCGPVEYALKGDGYPALVIHGAMGGFDQGLLLAEGNLDSSFQTIAVSRFGYLGSPRPENATLNMQADAYACLLDNLKIEKAVVFATSAGATSAIRFTARHPQRVAALVLLSPAAPGEVVVANPPLAVFDTFLRSDFVYWSTLTFMRPFMARMMGIPADLVLTPAMQAELTAAMTTTLPVSGRIDGMLSDFTLAPEEFYTELSDNAPYPLRDVQTPVLALNALDDPLAVPQNVRALAEKFPRATLTLYANGGHMLLGRGQEVRAEIARFLKANLAVQDGISK